MFQLLDCRSQEQPALGHRSRCDQALPAGRDLPVRLDWRQRAGAGDFRLVDIHSYSRPDLVRVRHLNLDLDVDFDRRVLTGSVTLELDRTAGAEVILDTRDLTHHF